MTKQTFTTGQVLTAAQMTSLQQTAMGGGSTTAKTASYVLVAADAGTVVQMNSASATTITVNTALFAAGDTVQIQNVGSGICTVTAGTATINTSSTLALKQYDSGDLYFNSTSAALFFNTDAADSTSPLTTKGDLYGFSTLDARIPIGTNNQVLTADSAQALGLKWATPSSGGKVLQVVQGTTSTQVINTTLTPADSGVTATITPSLATSKILVMVALQNTGKDATNASDSVNYQILRGATNLGVFNTLCFYQNLTYHLYAGWSANYLDSPSTTSATTYKVQFATAVASSSAYVNKSNAGISTIILMEIGA